MARARVSDTGMLELPRALRDAVGLMAGSEVEITESAGRLIVEPVPSVAPLAGAERKLSVQEFLDRIPVYNGPPIELTEKMIDDALLAEAKRRWEKVERQWHDDDSD